jgi:arylsulfatase A-like enzyme
MPHETGVLFNDQPLRPSVPTVGEVFREAGYETVWCGKWHLPASYVDDYDGVRGFDNIPHTRNQRNLYGLGDQVDFLHAMDAVFLLRWELHKVGLPWLLGVSLHNPHDICHWTTIPPRPHPNVDRYPPLPDNFGVPADEPEFLKMQQFGPRYNGRKGTERVLEWSETQWRAYIEAYYHLTEQADRAVGLILDALAEGGWLENTLVIFTSDHGDGCAAHQWVGKNSFYEEQVNVPLIVSFPGRVPEGGTDNEHLVSGLDVVPTMCDYAGVEPPLTWGRSLRPAIEDPGTDWRDHVVSEVAAPKPGDEERYGRMVRGQRYKYCVYSVGERREQLFDMREDPGEMVNLASEPGLKDVVAEHRGTLREWTDATDDPFPLD